MAVLGKEEFMKQLNDIVGDNTSDEALSFLENASDTIDYLSKQVTEAGDWKKKFETNDANWRQKYRERFAQPSLPREESDDTIDEEDDDQTEELTFENLFKTKE